MSDLEFHANQMAATLDQYFEHRYHGVALDTIKDRTIGDDSALARVLYNYRADRGWPEPEMIGESRCITCHKVMDDEPSAYVDETVCHACAGDDDV